MTKLLVLNGPNLNLLGTREPGQYGHETLKDVEEKCRQVAAQFDCEVECFQSNTEGHLIDAIHKAGVEFKNGECVGVVFNPGAYTHTSIALHDAIKGVDVPVIEVHISNVHAREEFRHVSYIAPNAKGIISGFGLNSYDLAIEGILTM